jgi:predicted phage tail protein
MATIKLYGELAEKFNNEYKLDVSSPKEAVRALCLMVPNFKKTFSEGNYFLYTETNELEVVDENNFDFASKGDIHIVPEIMGAKGGLGKIVAGIALIGLTFIPGANVAVLGALAATPLQGGALMAAQGLVMAAATNLGFALILGGAAMILAPKVKSNSEAADKQQSYIFDGSDINIQNGAPVPIVYGEVLAATYPISVEVTDVQAAPYNPDVGYNGATGAWNVLYQQIRDL